jgi:hypothetical protein
VKEIHTRITLESGSVFVCRYSPEYYLDQPVSRGLIGLFLPRHGVAVVAVDDTATVEPVTVAIELGDLLVLVHDVVVDRRGCSHG